MAIPRRRLSVVVTDEAEGFAEGRPLADIAEETGLSESEVLRREVELKLIPHFAAVQLDALGNNSSALH
jgi:hypothetical protein